MKKLLAMTLVLCFAIAVVLSVSRPGVIDVVGVTDAAETPVKEPRSPFRDLKAKTIDGKVKKLDDYIGQVVLVVNTASECGFTGQYETLEKLYRKYRNRGFVVLGFPCNDFGGQEPGPEAQIQQFCSEKFSISFPLFGKIHVKGEGQHPLYKALTERGPEDLRGGVKWNFTKFLLDRGGHPVARFSPFTDPMNDDVVAAVERALGPKK